MGVHNQKPHYEHLKNKWTDQHKKLREKLWSKHGESLHWLAQNAKHVAAGSAASLLLLSSLPKFTLPSPQLATANEHVLHKDIDKNVFLISDLSTFLPKEMRPLTISEEDEITKVLSRDFGFKVTPQLEGKRLERNYGLIGAEQHLARYPGDTMSTHFQTEEAREFYSSGMAPRLGAWGYFVPSASQLTEKDVQREKYYISAQTFLSERFNERLAEYRDFYKYRKMLVVNPQNGKAIVAIIGDAGPATFTGKHLGGSPEVMKHLERVDGSLKGQVLYFFIDDEDDKIPLGPISIQ